MRDGRSINLPKDDGEVRSLIESVSRSDQKLDLDFDMINLVSY